MKELSPITVVGIVLIAVVLGCKDSRIGKAQDLVRMGDTDHARQILDQVIRDDPNDAEAQALEGLVYEQAKDWADTEKALQRAATIDASYSSQIASYLSNRALGKQAELCGVGVSPNQLLAGSGQDYLADAIALDSDLGRDENVCYHLYVLFENDPEKFLTLFPNSDRAPSILLDEARAQYVLNSERSKGIYQKLAKDFPSSKEAAEARHRLADWWDRQAMTLPFDRTWHLIRFLKAGEGFRLNITGSARINFGAFGYQDMGPGKVMGYLGNSPAWELPAAYGTTPISVQAIAQIKGSPSEAERGLHFWALSQDALNRGQTTINTLQTNYFLPGASYTSQATEDCGLYLAIDSNPYQASLNVEAFWREPTATTEERSAVSPSKHPDATRSASPILPFSITQPYGWSGSTSKVALDERFSLRSGAQTVFVEWRKDAGADLMSYPAQTDKRWFGRKKGYSKIQLVMTTFHGYQAAVWEYLRSTNDGPMRRIAYYFIAHGNSYAVDAEAPAREWPQLWPQMDQILQSFRA